MLVDYFLSFLHMQKQSLIRKVIALGGTAHIDENSGDVVGRLGDYTISTYKDHWFGISCYKVQYIPQNNKAYGWQVTTVLNRLEELKYYI